MARHVLIVDDDRTLLAALSAELRSRGFRTGTAASGRDALEAIDRDPPDIVLLDLRLGPEDGLEILEQIQVSSDSPPPVLMISGAGTIAAAVSAMRMGAVDFIEKPITAETVALRITRVLRDVQLESECRDLRRQVSAAHGLLGKSEAIRNVLKTIELVAPTDGWVLISGESGTGKELVARAIHAGSPRAREPFVAVNCSAIPRDLVESELFGHQRGAFTGATHTRRGRFEEASGGTLFLDEIGEMPIESQPKLLRVLEERRVTRLGGGDAVPTDVRIVSATHHDLRAAVRESRFREDLYHRLNVVGIELPPLRDRLEDLPELCDHFLAFYARQHGLPALTLSDGALDAMRRHRWSGNVRELRNLMERLVILCRSTPVEAADLRALSAFAIEEDGWEAPPLETDDAPLKSTLRTVERRLVERTLREEGDNVTRAARRLGLERSHLHRKLRELGITRDTEAG